MYKVWNISDKHKEQEQECKESGIDMYTVKRQRDKERVKYTKMVYIQRQEGDKGKETSIMGQKAQLVPVFSSNLLQFW